MMMHFVGIKDERIAYATRYFGPPDFLHRWFDKRVGGDIAPGDDVIFGEGDENSPVKKYVYDDSGVQ